MSRAVTCDVILTGASTRSDGSLSIRLSTPELPAESKTVFFELLNQNLKMLLQPTDGSPAELHDVKGEFDRKTPSQRLRAVIFIWWRQLNEPGEFEDFYRKKTEVLINYVKDQLKPV
jgi:hypothetical protein